MAIINKIVKNLYSPQILKRVLPGLLLRLIFPTPSLYCTLQSFCLTEPPPEGLISELNIQEVPYRPLQQLITSSTCFWTIKVPHFENFEQFENKLQNVLSHQAYFGHHNSWVNPSAACGYCDKHTGFQLVLRGVLNQKWFLTWHARWPDISWAQTKCEYTRFGGLST